MDKAAARLPVLGVDLHLTMGNLNYAFCINRWAKSFTDFLFFGEGEEEDFVS